MKKNNQSKKNIKKIVVAKESCCTCGSFKEG